MAKKIVWNKRAIVKLDEIIEYQLEEVSEESAKKFFERLTENLDWLSRYPEIGRKSKKKKTI